jgi:hypothetical protein
MFNVIKFVVFAWWLPKHGLRSVNILRYVASSASAQPLLLANFTQSELIGNTIIKGFTEMLENDTANGDEDGDSPEEDARIAVINLLLHGLAFPAPSLSHFLLGFDLRNIARSTIQPPGIHCNLLSILQRVGLLIFLLRNLSCIRCLGRCAFAFARHNCVSETIRLQVTISRSDVIATSG